MDIQMGMERQGSNKERGENDGGETGAIVGMYDKYWGWADCSKWTPELGWAHTAFEMGRGWGLNWAMCAAKYFDFESTWGFVTKGGSGEALTTSASCGVVVEREEVDIAADPGVRPGRPHNK
jgi:hypothetical protein